MLEILDEDIDIIYDEWDDMNFYEIDEEFFNVKQED